MQIFTAEKCTETTQKPFIYFPLFIYGTRFFLGASSFCFLIKIMTRDKRSALPKELRAIWTSRFLAVVLSNTSFEKHVMAEKRVVHVLFLIWSSKLLFQLYFIVKNEIHTHFTPKHSVLSIKT